MQFVRVILGVVSVVMPSVVAASALPQAATAGEQPTEGQQAPEPPRKKDDTSKPVTHEKEEPPAPKAVEEGIVPKSIRIPGTDLSLKIGGYAKVDFIQDFSAIGNAYNFQTSSIPAEGTDKAAESGRTTIHARETRVNFELRSPGKDKFRVFVEGDFYGDGNAFRLRHAYGEFRGFLGGQNWSTFRRIVVLITDRNITMAEAMSTSRSRDYEVSGLVMELKKGEDGKEKGTGTMFAAAKIGYNKEKNQVEIESLGQQPIKLTDIRRDK